MGIWRSGSSACAGQPSGRRAVWQNQKSRARAARRRREMGGSRVMTPLSPRAASYAASGIGSRIL